MQLTSLASRPLENLLRSRLAEALTAPHGVDRYLDWLAPQRVADELRSRVLARRDETSDSVTLTLAAPRGWQCHRAGQHITVSVELNGRRQTRCFSIASADNARGDSLEITVKAQADGQVSRHLVEGAVAGMSVVLSPAQGEFVLPEARPAGVLLISGGSGITPVMSMLRSLVNEGYQGDILFLHYARRYEDLIFADELAALDTRHANLKVVRAITGESTRPGDQSGHFDPEHLQNLGPDACDWPAYACGPQALIESARAYWSSQEASDRLQYEFFQPPRTEVLAGDGQVRFARSAVSGEDNGSSLLEQAEAAGLKPVYGCRMGICRSCTCRKTSGRVRNLLTGEISGEAEEDIQPCITAPAGDVTVDL